MQKTGFQMLMIVTSMQKKSGPDDDETDEDEDNTESSSKGTSNANAFSARETAMKFFDKLPSVPNELIRNQPAYDPTSAIVSKRPRALLEHDFINFPQAKKALNF
ncbi:hypothetical protein TNCV_1440801 [Trichonephila clavipes]|nr:hypothetical protein TNCV_1440801 [Trichonephila clavipes]